MAAVGGAAADLRPSGGAGTVGQLITTGAHSAASPPAVVVARAGEHCLWTNAAGFSAGGAGR